MGKQKESVLLQKAIRHAILDRETFIEAVGSSSEDGKEAAEEIKAIMALAGKRLTSLSREESEAAKLAFIYAEQYELGFADCRPEEPYLTEALALAAEYKAVRIRLWGKTKMENFMENAKAISIFEIIKGTG